MHDYNPDEQFDFDAQDRILYSCNSPASNGTNVTEMVSESSEDTSDSNIKVTESDDGIILGCANNTAEIDGILSHIYLIKISQSRELTSAERCTSAADSENNEENSLLYIQIENVGADDPDSPADPRHDYLG